MSIYLFSYFFSYFILVFFVTSISIHIFIIFIFSIFFQEFEEFSNEMKFKILPIIEKKSQKPTENLYGEMIYYNDEKSNIVNRNKVSMTDGRNDDVHVDVDGTTLRVINKNKENKEKKEKKDKDKNSDNVIEYNYVPSAKIIIPIPKGGVISWRDLSASSAVKLIKKNVNAEVQDKVHVGDEVEKVEMFKKVQVEIEEETDVDAKNIKKVKSESIASSISSAVDRSTSATISTDILPPLRSSQPLSDIPTDKDLSEKKSTSGSSGSGSETVRKYCTDSANKSDLHGSSSAPEIKVV